MRSVTKPTTSGRARRDAVRGQVLDAVEGLLRDGETFTKLGIGRISDAAGVSRSAFYLHFSDKTALLMALTEQASSEVFTGSAAWVESQLGLGADALTDTLMGSLSTMRQHEAVLNAYREVAGYDAEVAAYWTEQVEAIVAALAERIVEGQAAGDFRDDIVARPTAELIVWGAERTMTQHIATTGQDLDPPFAAGLARAVAAMLYRP